MTLLMTKSFLMVEEWKTVIDDELKRRSRSLIEKRIDRILKKEIFVALLYTHFIIRRAFL